VLGWASYLTSLVRDRDGLSNVKNLIILRKIDVRPRLHLSDSNPPVDSQNRDLGETRRNSRALKHPESFFHLKTERHFSGTDFFFSRAPKPSAVTVHGMVSEQKNTPLCPNEIRRLTMYGRV
jgi:hypothetical protein